MTARDSYVQHLALTLAEADCWCCCWWHWGRSNKKRAALIYDDDGMGTVHNEEEDRDEKTATHIVVETSYVCLRVLKSVRLK